MTRLPGRVDLTPVDLDAWIAQLARALPAIHATPAPMEHHPEYVDFHESWRDHPAAALARTASRTPTGTLIHGDFQHFNVLWSRRRLTGIVDWAYATQGHPDTDVGHCMLNLVLRFDAGVAERFRLVYEAEAGRATDPAVLTARLLVYTSGWKAFLPLQAVGVQLDLDGMDGRHADLVERTVRRAG